MGVADLLVAETFLLPGRFVIGPNQARVGEELADRLETANVVDFVEQDQGKDRADAGNGPQSLAGLHVIDLGGPGQVAFEVGDACVGMIDPGKIDLDRLLDAGIGEAIGDGQFGAVGSITEFLAEGRQVEGEDDTSVV